MTTREYDNENIKALLKVKPLPCPFCGETPEFYGEYKKYSADEVPHDDIPMMAVHMSITCMKCGANKNFNQMVYLVDDRLLTVESVYLQFINNMVERYWNIRHDN